MENTEYLNLPAYETTTREKHSLSRIHLIGIGTLMAFLGLMVGYVLAKRLNIHDELAARAREVSAGPFVQTAVAALSGPEKIIKELGETRAYASVTLYAKVSGYLNEIFVDKGDTVKKGQILATILSPEISSQYAAAVADEKNKRIQSSRMRELFKERTVSDEEKDQAVAQADIAAARLQELGAQKSYATLIAPFDGTVTARFADPGALVQDAANARSGALPVVTVSQTERLRVTTFIDQSDSSLVQVGDPVAITLSERPGVVYEARVTRKAGELDPRSRTMLTEIELDNPRNEVVSGGFVDVLIKVKMPQSIQISTQALVMRGSSPYVAVVSSDGVIHYRPIKIGENDGTLVTVLSGLEDGEMVVMNMGNSLIDGQHVQVDNEGPK